VKEVKHAPQDLVLEATIAAEYGQSYYAWRNRRRNGKGPAFYRTPGKRQPTYYSRKEVAECLESPRP